MSVGAHAAYSETDVAPVDWRERGIVMPFTTPALAFARVRQGSNGHLEVVVRSPDGLKGLYAIRLNALSGFASPTLFDRRWLRALMSATVPDRAAIAKARDDALRSGLAGRPAMRAIALAEESARARVNATLAGIMGIVANANGPEVPPPTATPESILAFAVAHRDRFARMASRIGATAETFTDGLRRFANGLLLMSRVQRDIAELRRMRTEVENARLLDEAEFVAQKFVLDAAAAALRVAERDIARFRERATNPLLSIAQILRDYDLWLTPARDAAQALDGWRLLVAFWDGARQIAPGEEPRAVWCLGRAAPPLPSEIDEGMGEEIAALTVRDRWPSPPPRLRAMGTTPRQEELEWAISQAM